MTASAQSFGPTVDIHYAKGTTILREDQPALNPDKLPPSVGSLAAPELDAAITAAVAAAKASDQVVLVLGEADDMSGEYASRASLTLPGKQQLLLEAVAATGKPLTLVLGQRPSTRHHLGVHPCPCHS